MKIKISKSCLLNALVKTASIADRKSAIPIVSNVLIETKNDTTICVSATNLNISISGVLQASVLEDGAITVPAKMLCDVVRKMPNGQITLTKKGDFIQLASGRAKFKLLGLPVEDFPKFPDTNGLEYFTLDAALVASMIEKTVFSISDDETRPHISGALFQGEGKILRMVTTDGHRLSKYETDIDHFYTFSYQ